MTTTTKIAVTIHEDTDDGGAQAVATVYPRLGGIPQDVLETGRAVNRNGDYVMRNKHGLWYTAHPLEAQWRPARAQDLEATGPFTHNHGKADK